MNGQQKVIFIGLLAGVAYYLYKQQPQSFTDVETAAQGAESDVTAAIAGWKNAGQGPTWVPILNAAESQYGLPQDLLAALAYQESSFIENVIRGIKTSSAGALGMMQLMPQYYPSVNVPKPFQDSDVEAQITDAATTLLTNYASTQSWPLAIAAYNAGLGAVQNAGGIPQNGQTPAYVAGILSNAPAAAVS